MSLVNLSTIIKIAADKKAIKQLYDIYRVLKEDKSFGILKYIKMMLSIMKGEKLVSHEGQYIVSTFFPPFPSKAFFQNLMAVDNPDNIFTQQIYAKRSAPISMYLCVTSKCPNNCIYCSSKNRIEEAELTTQEWVKVIKELQDMRTPIIGLTGGEPMTRVDIYELVSAIDDRSISTLFTSGFNLNIEKARELKKSGLFSIGISLDSYDKNRHNENRNSEKAFDYALTALQNARNAGIYTMAQTVIVKEEVDEEKLFRLFKIAKDNGAHEVKILEPIYSGKLLTHENLNNILYDNSTRRKLIEIQHKANKRRDMPKITTFAYTESRERFGCGAGTQHSYVSASGHLYPCDFVPMSFGCVKEQSIKNLWKEMNQIIGIPKSGCFAQQINKQVIEKSKGILPLDRNESIELCVKNRASKFPKYYRDLQ